MVTPRDYGNALGEMHKADEDMKHMGRQLKSFADRMLAFPQETCFADIEGEPEPPLDQLITGARWYAQDFPTPERLQAALRRRYDARQKALRIWGELAEHQRQGAPTVPA